MDWKKDSNDIYIRSSKNQVISYPKDGNDKLFLIEENSGWFRERNNLIITLLKKYNLTGDFLDIGGGNGYQAGAIENEGLFDKVIFCEPGYQGCLNAKKRGLNYIFNGFFQEVPLNEFNVSAVGLFDVLEHIEDHDSFLRDIKSKVGNKTFVFINVPAFQFLWSETDIDAGHFRRYTKNSLRETIIRSGFNMLECGYFFSYYFLPVLFLRSIPFKLGLKKGKEVIHKNKMRNHKASTTFSTISKVIHSRALSKVKKGKGEFFGTSLYAVLQSQ